MKRIFAITGSLVLAAAALLISNGAWADGYGLRGGGYCGGPGGYGYHRPGEQMGYWRNENPQDHHYGRYYAPGYDQRQEYRTRPESRRPGWQGDENPGQTEES
ncbi:hypothetical protein [Dethiosulfatarculus sandiegensis]|uniref:Sulfur globule protein n=1 Tax=Dethiosulfatarculus sandiegensis TaxID=1429043 RepID=A0A0D2HQS4_9BACT|nr:hypothetical protein [Dethiosulfatarculus sandiegensis]KIX12828.1 hypothetical protein X474_17010 [Dethiosulfatarculus sandiegensis]